MLLSLISSFLTPNFILPFFGTLQGVQEAKLRTGKRLRRRGELRLCRGNNKETHIHSESADRATTAIAREGDPLALSIYISIIKLSLQSTVPHIDIYGDG